jgi:hypothetical protein
MRKSILLSFIAILIASFSTAQSNSLKLHIKTFNEYDASFIEREEDGPGSGSITYFNEFFDELYIFVEIDLQNISKYNKRGEYKPFTLRVSTTKGKVQLKEFKKAFGFENLGDENVKHYYILFQLNNVSFDTYKFKADLMNGNKIIGSAKKTVEIWGGE